MKTPILHAALAALIAATASGAILFEEGFESYTANATTLNGQGNWTHGSGQGNWTVNDANDANSGLRPSNYANGTVTIGNGTQAAILTSGDRRIINGDLVDQTATPVYVSFLMKHLASGSGSNSGAPFYLFSSNDEGTQVGLRGNGSNSNSVISAYASLNGNTNTAGQFVQSGLLDINQTFFLVIRLSVSGGNGTNYDSLDFWVNPNDASAPSFTAGTNGYIGNVTFNSGSSSVNGVSLFGDNRTPHGGVDSIRVGEGWTDVVIPEPSALVLAGLGLAGLGVRRRR